MGPVKSVMTVEISLGGAQFVALNGGSHFQLTEAVSLTFDCEDQRGRLSLGQTLSEWRAPLTMRLAQGPLGSVVANHSKSTPATSFQKGTEHCPACNRYDAPNDQTRCRDAGTRGCRLVIHTSIVTGLCSARFVNSRYQTDFSNLEDPMQWPSASSQFVDSSSHSRVFDQWGSVMRFDSCVDDQRAGAAPMLLVDERTDAIDVSRGIRTCEDDP